MKQIYSITVSVIFIIFLVVSSCVGQVEVKEKKGHEELTSSKKEHPRDGNGESKKSSESGEENGTEYGKDETFSQLRRGALLTLKYNAKENTFTGMVENKTKKTLKRVRIEIHLSNGVELGPTTPVDLKAGEKRSIRIKASKQPFERWNAHPETGESEHGSAEGHEEKEGHETRERGEHGKRESKSEHN